MTQRINIDVYKISNGIFGMNRWQAEVTPFPPNLHFARRGRTPQAAFSKMYRDARYGPGVMQLYILPMVVPFRRFLNRHVWRA